MWKSYASIYIHRIFREIYAKRNENSKLKCFYLFILYLYDLMKFHFSSVCWGDGARVLFLSKLFLYFIGNEKYLGNPYIKFWLKIRF